MDTGLYDSILPLGTKLPLGTELFDTKLPLDTILPLGTGLYKSILPLGTKLPLGTGLYNSILPLRTILFDTIVPLGKVLFNTILLTVLFETIVPLGKVGLNLYVDTSIIDPNHSIHESKLLVTNNYINSWFGITYVDKFNITHIRVPESFENLTLYQLQHLVSLYHVIISAPLFDSWCHIPYHHVLLVD